jgi:hypothetical protein
MTEISGRRVVPASAFSHWLDTFFDIYYRRRPVNATFIGVHTYDHLLPACSPEGLTDSVNEMRALLQALRSLPEEPLSQAEAMDRRLAEGFLEIALWEAGSSHFEQGNPSYYTGEAIFGVLSLFLRPFAPLADRVESAISRLQAIPTLLGQAETNVRRAPAAWTARALRECRGALAFLASGLDLLLAGQDLDESRLRAAARVAAAAFTRYHDYLEHDLLARPSDSYACGEVAFDLLLRRGHCLDRDAGAIEAYAVEQLQQSAAYLAAHAADFGAAGPAEALASLADLHPDLDHYYARFTETWERIHATVVAGGVVTWPDYPIRYVPQPPWARGAAPFLYFLPYRAPAAFDAVTPVEYLVPSIDADLPAAEQLRRLRATNDSVITLNHVVHHGGLGHHVQNYYAYRAASRIGRVAAVDCASRIAMFCGGTMAEGWACYATELAGELGCLTPLEQYAEQHTRLRMAARAIVDIRLHRGELTLAGAADSYRDTVGMAAEAAEAEAVKNSMFPGAAVMYLMGTDLIHDLRREIAAREGSDFSLRGFHDRLLSFGSVPVSLIAAAMRAENPAAP